MHGAKSDFYEYTSFDFEFHVASIVLVQLFSDEILTKSLTYFAANAEEPYKPCENKNVMIIKKWNYFLANCVLLLSCHCYLV